MKSSLRDICYYTASTILLMVIFAGGMFCAMINYVVVDFSSLTQESDGRPSLVLDDEGNELCKFQYDRREPVALADMPPHLIQTFLAAEDWHFFSHTGLSFKGMIRSFLVNLRRGKIVQGASTITQQLVRLLFFDYKRTFKRKIKEQFYTLLVERQCTKEQILQTYLNHIYFGCGIYGVEAACQRFWNCSVTQISVDQAAVLAGIIRSPGRYCPLLNPENSLRLRNTLLESMSQRGLITAEECKTLKEKPLGLVAPTSTGVSAHLKEMIRNELEERVGRTMLYTGGLVIQTTINSSMQQAAEQALKNQIASLRESMDLPVDGALFSFEHTSGEIKAVVGGYDFNESKFNRALQARRQIGSVFKPIIYAAALKSGKNFTQTALDEPYELQEHGRVWAPKNHNLTFEGEMTLARALSHSNNIISIKTLLDVGIDSVVELAERTHLSGPIYSYPSLALGCVDATLAETVGMFSVFANDGLYTRPHLVRWVKDRYGSKILIASPERERVLESKIAGQVAKVLELGINRVKKRYPHLTFPSQLISKTGTTNDSRTCWFVGSSPTLTTGVYIGCDDNRSLGINVFPIHTAFPIWAAYQQSCVPEKKRFFYDPDLKEVWIDERTGKAKRLGEPGAIAVLVS